MRTILAAAAALSLLAGISAGAARADDAMSVSDYANAMNDAAARLDAQVSDRQQAGDMAAAQRFVLAAAMVRRSAEEMRGAEQASLPDPVDSLPAPIPGRARAALAEAVRAQQAAGGEPRFLDEAQTTFNALLAALPVKQPHPVFYGLLAADLADPATPLPSDVAIYGYRLVDPQLNIAPVVTYGPVQAPVAVHDDRLDVTLPAEVKAAVHFAPSPCESRAGFALRVRAVYAEPHGVWPIAWTYQLVSNADLFALPTPVVYAASISTLAQTAAPAVATVEFHQKSDLVVAGCERTQAAEVVAPIPDAAVDVTCAAAWVDTTGAVKTASRCQREGATVRATGEIEGGATICSPDKLCTCPAEAQGWLEARGSYKMQQNGATTRLADGPALNFPAGGLAQTRLTASAGETLRSVSVSISRRACPTVADAISLAVGADAEGEVDAVSKTGAFRAALKGEALTVGAADAFSAALGRTP